MGSGMCVVNNAKSLSNDDSPGVVTDDVFESGHGDRVGGSGGPRDLRNAGDGLPPPAQRLDAKGRVLADIIEASRTSPCHAAISKYWVRCAIPYIISTIFLQYFLHYSKGARSG